MTFRERISSWFGRKPVEAIPFHQMQSAYFGPGIGNQPHHTTLLRESLGIADMATRAIANRVSSLNPQVKVTRETKPGTTEDEILDDHILKRLLDRPHPNFSRSQLLRLTAQWIVTVGEAYWLKVGNGFGIPIELHPIPPAQCWPVLSGGVVSAYGVMDGQGRTISLPAETIVRFFFPDPENPWASEGYLGPAGITADSLKFAGQHLRRHYEHNATPPTVLETNAEAQKFNDPEEKAFIQRWRNRFHRRLGSDPDAPVILPLGYKLVQMMLQSGADITPLLEHWRDDQLMGFGVPRSVLGQVVSGDRSSAETNQYVFDLHTIHPIATMIAEALTLQLARDFDPAIFVEFDGFVSEDKQFRLLQEQSDLQNKVRSINMVLKDRGMDPVGWGDLPVGQIGNMPYDGMGFDLAEDQTDAFGGDDEDEEPEEEPEPPRGRASRPDPADYDSKDEFMDACIPVVVSEGKTPKQAAGQCAGMWENRSARAAAFFTPHAEWLRQVAREKKYVPTFLRAIRTIFRDQQKSVLARLEATQPRARVSADDIFDPDEWARLFQIRLEPIRETAFLATANSTFAGLGVDASFVFTDSMRELLKRQGAQLMKNVNQTTKNLIRRQLIDAAGEGEGIEAIAKRIRGVFDTRRHHARTIARTEVLKSSQTAQIESFEQSGVVEKKRWNTSMDAAVRDSHNNVLEPVVGIREAFMLPLPNGGTEQADAPGIALGGGTLSAANAINCRCFVTPVVET